MSNFIKVFLLTALLAGVCAHDADADKKTVCSITVNSPDEKEAFRRSLPPNKYQFVAAPTGWNRHAVRVFDAMFSLSPGTTMVATSSSRINWRLVSICQSPKWNASRAATRVLDCFHN